MLAPRAAAFRKLDADGNNLLSFQEWAVRTTTASRGADGNRDSALTREEFATTKPKPSKQPSLPLLAAAAPDPPRRGAGSRASA